MARQASIEKRVFSELLTPYRRCAGYAKRKMAKCQERNALSCQSVGPR
jgi:hypothetical protein